MYSNLFPPEKGVITHVSKFMQDTLMAKLSSLEVANRTGPVLLGRFGMA